MSILNRWMDKEVVVHIHNGILFSHKKEYIWVRSNEVDQPRAYYTEWSNSERKTPIQYINTYIWFFQWSCMNYKESWAPKNWCFGTVVLEKTLENPLDCKESQPVLPKGDQSWVFIGRTDVDAETPILWPPDTKSWLIGKDPDAWKGKIEGRRRRGRQRMRWDDWMALKFKGLSRLFYTK